MSMTSGRTGPDDSDRAAGDTAGARARSRRLAAWWQLVLVWIAVLAADGVIVHNGRPSLAFIAFATGAAVTTGYLAVRRRRRRPAPTGVTPPAPEPETDLVVPIALPPPPLPFVDRETEIARIEAALQDRQPAGCRIALVHGAAGIGKTALAVHVAHRIAGQYPDGLLYAVLTAVSPTAAGTGTGLGTGTGTGLGAGTEAPVLAVLRSLVRALQTSSDPVPPGLPEARQALRRLTTGKRILLVLDDIPAGADISPLLPADPLGAVILTSRHPQPVVLPEPTVALEPLPTEAGVRMLGGIVGSDRVTMASQRLAAVEIVRGSASLPLALRLTGTSLAARPSWDLRWAVERLDEERRKAGGSASGSAAALDMAYLLLPELQQLALRRLGLRDTPEFAPWMVKALLPDQEVDDQGAWRIADRLVHAGMVERLSDDSAGVPQFRILDGVWPYAVARGAAAGDLTSGQAEALMTEEKQRRDAISPFVLLRKEGFGMLAAGRLTEAMPIARDVLMLARERGEPREVGLALAALAEFHSELGNLSEAAEFAQRAIDHGDLDGRVRGLRCRAIGRRRSRQLPVAEAILTEALGLVAPYDAAERVRLLRDLAWVVGLGPAAATALPLIDEALSLCDKRLRNGAWQLPGVLHARAVVHRGSGDLQAARQDLHRARVSAEDTDRRLWQGWLDQAQARIALDEGQLQAAMASAVSGLEGFQRMRHRYGTAHCRLVVGEILIAREETGPAVAILDDALETFGNCGDRWAAARTSYILAQARLADGVEDAAELASSAAATFAELGDDTRAAAARQLVRTAAPASAVADP